MFLLTNCIVLAQLINLVVGESFEDFILDAHNKHRQKGGLTKLTYDSGDSQKEMDKLVENMCEYRFKPENDKDKTVMVYSASPSQSWSDPEDISFAKKAFEDTYDAAVKKFSYDEDSLFGCTKRDDPSAELLMATLGEETEKLSCAVKVFNIFISFLAFVFTSALCSFPLCPLYIF